MSDSGGFLKGMVVHTLLGGIEAHLTPAEVARVKDALEAARGAGSWVRLQSVRRLAWVSLDDYVAVVKATYDALGDAGYVAFWRKQGRVFFTDGAFAAIVRGFQSAFGFSATSVLRAMGTMWGMGAKDAGQFTFREGAAPGESTLVFDAPEIVLQPFFVLGLCEGLAAVFDLAQVEGTLKPGKRSPGQVELDARWVPKSAAAGRKAS